MHNFFLVKNAYLIPQDRASCLSAFAMFPLMLNNHDDFIDACAAPGNKTSHLASLASEENNESEPKKLKSLNLETKCNLSNVFAFDRNERRYKKLNSFVKTVGGHNIQCQHADFLKVDPEDVKYKNVVGILVDPSCSGSGLIANIGKV